MAALLLSACSQADTPNVPTAPNMPHETVTETQPVPLYPPAPVIEWAVPEEDPTRQETDVVSNDVFFEETATLWRTEYVYDQNGALMEIRTLTFDSQDRPLSAIIEKKDAEENSVYQKGVYYREDGTVDSADHMVFNSYGQEYLRWQYVCGEDGSVSEEYYDQYEYGENHKVCRKIFSRKVAGVLQFTQQEDFDDAGKLTKQSFWYFYEDGSVKEWSTQEQTGDGTPTKNHKITFNQTGSVTFDFLHRYDISGALLEMKELRCYENGAVQHDFYERYAPDGTLLEQSRLQYRENGDIYFLHKQKNDESGKEIYFHHEQYFDDGTLEHKHLKEYDEQGQLRKSEYLSYYSADVPASISRAEYDADGKLLKKESIEYNADGSIASESKYPAEGTEFIPTTKKTFHPNGNPEFVCDGLYHTNGTLMDGREERYYENGQLWILQEASYDESTRTRISTETRYLEDGTVDIAWQRTEVFDEDWRRTVYDSMSLTAGLQSQYHEIYQYTYDENGNVAKQTYVSYDGNGAAVFNNETEYSYDSKGNLLRENRIQFNADGSFQSRLEILYTCSESGKQTGRETVQYDASDSLVYRLKEEYNDADQLVRRVTETPNTTQTEENTYLEDGRPHTLLVTITPKAEGKDPVTQYRKTTYEYYENGVKKSETVQTWTSQDEKKAAPGTPQSELGSTYTTQFDEQGNRI
jgi:hypothetical protein